MDEIPSCWPYRVAFTVAQTKQVVADSQRFSHTAQRKARSYIDKVADNQLLHHHTAYTITSTLTPSTKRPFSSPQSYLRAHNTTTMTSTIGIPIKLLNESTVSPPRKLASQARLVLTRNLSQLTRHAIGSPSHR
jgi:hypothetical protein